MNTLMNKALLVHIKISLWGNRKLDKTATAAVEQSYDTEGKVGIYTKKLLPDAPEVEKVNRLAGILRKFFVAQTLPWFSDGTRIIAAKHYMEFAQDFAKQKAEFEQAVDAFLLAYPRLCAEAQSKLGALYSIGDYPDLQTLRGAYACDIVFLPVPDVTDFRAEISEAEKDKLVQTLRDTERRAVRECFEKLIKVTRTAAERLSQPDTVFRDSLFQNVTDVCALLSKLNITGDAMLESMRTEVARLVDTTDVVACRKSPDDRAAAAQSLASITERMTAIMGG